MTAMAETETGAGEKSEATTTSTPAHTTTACCPGKVLLAGGYLVLESPNPGIVLAADGTGGSSRFFATVTALPAGGASAPDGATAATKAVGEEAMAVEAGDGGYARRPLDVHSPQFDAVFRYWLDYIVPSDGAAAEIGSTTADDGDGQVLLRLSPRCPKLHQPNVYVERTLALTLAYVQRTLGLSNFASRLASITSEDDDPKHSSRVLSVKLRAGNDFYSPLPHLKSRGNLSPTPANVSSLPPFLPCPKVTDEETGRERVVVNKTGMGSSAALVTSLVGAILSYFGVIALPKLGGVAAEGDEKEAEKVDANNDGQRLAHNLAQVCHCSAQGKVGSGFDVSAAVHGTHVYRRFSKSVLADLLESIDGCTTNASGSDASCSAVTSRVATDLSRIVTDVDGTLWDSTVVPLALPPGLEVLMADVCGGSESPSMARKVLAWRKKEVEERKEGRDDGLGGSPWDGLERTNTALEELFRTTFADEEVKEGLRRFGPTRLASMDSQGWTEIGNGGSSSKGDDDDDDAALLRRAASALLEARHLFQKARTDLKRMGTEAGGVPIEPDGQTELADATMALPGVLAAGVPGAGGYDALFALYVKGPDVDVDSSSGSGGGGRSDAVRERIGELWRGWGGGSGSDSGRDGVETVCPLAVRGAAGNGGNFGLCESDLGW